MVTTHNPAAANSCPEPGYRRATRHGLRCNDLLGQNYLRLAIDTIRDFVTGPAFLPMPLVDFTEVDLVYLAVRLT